MNKVLQKLKESVWKIGWCDQYVDVIAPSRASCFYSLLQHIDKVFKHKDLQQQLVDAKLHQAQALLKDSEDRHQKEKEFVSFQRTWF